MSTVASSDPEIAQVIENEQRRQRHQLVMIASENYTSAAVPVSYTHLTLPTICSV